MIRIETQIDIAQPPQRVWQVLTDFAAHEQWNPLMRKVQAEPRLGSPVTLHVRLRPDAQKLQTLRAKIDRWEPAIALSWSGGIPGILSATHWWRLEAMAGGTRLHHGEDFRGLIPLLKGKLFSRMRPAYERMNQALAARVAS